MAAKRAKKAAKKSAAKPAKKVAKRAVKKASSSKSAKKSASRAKKSAGRVGKKSASRAKKSAGAGVSLKVDVPEVPTRGVVTPSSTPKPKTPASATAAAAPEKKKNGSSPFFFIIIGVVALALIFFSQGSNDSNDPKGSGSGTVSQENSDDMNASDESMESEDSEESTDEMSASEEATDDSTSESTDSAGTPTAYMGPTGIVAQYTNSDKSAATIFWKAPASTEGVTGYAIQIQRNGGARTDLSSTPATQFSLDIAKSDTSGWTSFIVQTVYSDGTVSDGKVFGLPGQWN